MPPYASFNDSEGNRWLLQEITAFPGPDVSGGRGALAELLHEASEPHGAYEAVAPRHDWWDRYAAYVDARRRGSTPEEASEAAGQYMAEVKHVVSLA